MRAPVLPERALILGGGLGTRLASVLPDRPKILAPIAGRPFLDILVEALATRGLRRFVLLLGNQHEQVMEHVQAGREGWPDGIDIEFSIESSSLGTGGAVKLAERFCDGRFFLVNGDTYFDLDIAGLVHAHAQARALLTVVATEVADADRYGRLETSATGFIRRFREKDAPGGSPGFVNAGVYLVEPGLLGHIPAGRSVSLEYEVFPALLAAGEAIAVSPQTGAFFDIGTPTSYQRFADFCRTQGTFSGRSDS